MMMTVGPKNGVQARSGIETKQSVVCVRTLASRPEVKKSRREQFP
jgi:hypothetical protein